VAVDANDFTVDKLLLQTADRSSAIDKSSEATALAGDVIELEDQWICLAAIRAVMRTQVARKKRATLLSAAVACRLALV
jgi:hypothetical protein